ncbi:ribose-phosphate diphosphokinase [Listeria fleischmannii]|jgi:ribose-phosphate pyrophosphokinase|nr:ribose-phosphate pyrophosphokinase [Listeria fleischmannii]EIA19163.1 ribose-phosphate pyrophosphokinase [Listeria fleischmannii subsp. coloradonensis]MBC1398569.1 ribose-phosphate pyrophosphokinase [Listeria fleischmannii]MBC1419942.1 ribose-phosphate pyrophosphokinase [Listeria fleischmannii]MBC1426630.1 ribose-phosphate pyrophosphokinase [Listeria fleischmannii]STY46454.1 Ribose-phosphate pyrophosphokinase [Listeria fleischmannii subsp. coloradonensis]
MSNEMRLFSVTNERPLAIKISKALGIPLCEIELQKFSDGEVKINIEESIRGKNCYVIQSMNSNVNERLIEMLIMIDALKRASAHSITVIMPYYGYSRQDRKAHSREPVTAKLIANLLQQTGATRLISVDLHAAQIQGFFNIPIDHISAIPLLTDHLISKYGNEDVVIVAPDHSGVVRARRVADKMNAPIAILNRKPRPNEREISSVIGDVRGKLAIVVDDIIDTGYRATTSADKLLASGASAVVTCATHAVLAGHAAERLAGSNIQEIVLTDAIDIPEEKLNEKMTIITIGEILAKAISGVQENRSLHPLF